MDVKEAYKVLQAACGIEAGDRVKVLRTFKSGEMGCEADPYNENGRMNSVVGKTGVVDTVASDAWIMIHVGGSYINVPFFCLELVEKASQIKVGSHNVEFTDDGIKVGCEKVSDETIKAIYNKRFGG